MLEQAGASAFVGRERELAQLLAALDDAERGRGRLILVAGPPGIGKTRLAGELTNAVRARGDRALWGRGWEEAGAPPYWPWIQVFRGLVRQIGPEAIRGHLSGVSTDLRPLLPEAAALAPPPGQPSAADPDTARFLLFDAATTLLLTAAQGTATAIFFDDAQAADASSILFLRFLAGQLSDSRLLVVVTVRDLELTRDHPFAHAVAQLTREPATAVVQLGGLAPEAIDELIGVTGGRRPRRRLVSVLARTTGGNPLFLREVLHLIGAEQPEHAIDAENLHNAVPAGIRQVIARRTSSLSAPALSTLRAAATLGPEFSLETLRRIAGLTSDQLLERLSPALEAGLILPTDAPGQHRFAHDLIREGLYADLAPDERTRLHRGIALALEAQYAGTLQPHLPELAYHSYHGLAAGDAAKAVGYATAAGRAAASGLAYDEAARQFRLALRAQALDENATLQERCELLLDLGDAEARAGDLAAAREAFLRAAVLAHDLGDGPRLARAALGYGGRFLWARAGADPHVIPLLQSGLATLAGADAALDVRLLSRLACAWRSEADRREQCAELTERAVTIARELGDPATLSYALAGRFWATYWPENPGERLAIARELLAVAEAARDGERAVDAHWALYVAHSDLGLMDQAKEQLAIVRRTAAELHQPVHDWALETYELVIALLEGDYPRAAALASAERGHDEIDPTHDEDSTARIHRFLLGRDLGSVAAEETSIRDAVREFPWYPYFRAALVCLLLDTDRETEARAVFDDLARDDARALYRDCEWLMGMSLASEACARLEDRAAAGSLYGQLLPFAGRLAIAHAEGALGYVDRYLGLLAATTGRLDDAERHLAESVRLNDALGAKPWSAHARADLAALLRQRAGPGDIARADELAAAARTAAARLGMATVGARREPVGEHSESPGERAGAAGPAARGTGVFRQEGDYWTVVFAGSSFRLHDSRGLGYLARLLASPGREIHVLELASGSRSDAGVGDASARHGDAWGARLGNAGEILDEEARRAYRARLDELEQEIDQADDWHDIERTERLRAERRALVEQLAAAVGLGGRARVAASAAERARLSVRKAIRSALERIEANSAPLGRHFAISVHTGTFCSYDPDPGLVLTWEL